MRLFACGAVFGLILVSQAQATDVLTGPGNFSGPTTTITFDGIPSGTIINTLYSASGVGFFRDDGQPIPAWDWSALGRVTTSPPNVLATILGSFIGGSASTFTNIVNVDFLSPVYQVGAYFGNDQAAGFTTTLSLFDASNNLVGSYSLAGNGNTSVDQFLGLESSAPFVRAEFTNNLTFLSVVLDNLEFSATPPSVPEPDTLALLGLGVFGVAAVRRRKHVRCSALPEVSRS
jgi:PEP-CTERM motif